MLNKIKCYSLLKAKLYNLAIVPRVTSRESKYCVVCFVFAKLSELNRDVWETLSFIYEPNDGDKSSVGWVIIGEDGIGLCSSLVPGWAVSGD